MDHDAGTRRRIVADVDDSLYLEGTEQRAASAWPVRRVFRLAIGGIPRDVTVTIQAPEGDPDAALTEMRSADRRPVSGRPARRGVAHRRGHPEGGCRSLDDRPEHGLRVKLAADRYDGLEQPCTRPRLNDGGASAGAGLWSHHSDAGSGRLPGPSPACLFCPSSALLASAGLRRS
jgi:hypothetical protein